MKKKYFVLCLIIGLSSFTRATNLPVIIEAESGQLGSDFRIVNEDGVTFATPLNDLANSSCPGNDSKVITFSVPFPEVGNYQIYARVRVGSDTYADDSFYLTKRIETISSTNADDWYTVNGIVQVGHTASVEVVTGAGSVGNMVWKWINISQYLNSQDPVIYSVDDISSPKTFSIGARENGLDIDKIAFGKDGFEYTVDNLDLIQSGTIIAGFPDDAYSLVKTFINPVLPGDHPDQTLIRVGNDFYTTGSSFHFTPYVPIYHSTDLVHWEIVSRVVTANSIAVDDDAPKAGVWQGALAQFGGYFWVYYSIGSTQHFSKATSMEGPWSAPTKVIASTVTGYDNSIFVDDDGTPYMLMKNGKYINRIQQVDKSTGQLTGMLINCDFINADGAYSWAEGPVMCKHDGWYYYFIAGNVGGGQYVIRTQALTDDPDSWESLGDFFATITDPEASFRAPNHMSQPVQLDDGTWWTLSHSYEGVNGDDWSGYGRQGLLHQVTWSESGKPTGKAPTSTPQLLPDLPSSDIPWNLPRSDYFDNNDLGLSWYFLNKTAASMYSLTEKAGWMTLNPGTGSTHILQREGGQYYSIVTKVDFDAVETGQEAGLYLTNGNESVTSSVYSGYNGGKKIGFRFNGSTVEVNNNAGKSVWLKVVRQVHQLSGFYSTDGIKWNQIGTTVSSVDLDKGQPEYNWWVGNSTGLYAQNKKAHFDMFIFKDAYTAMPAVGSNNYFGLEKKEINGAIAMTNTTAKGGWLMLGGVDLGQEENMPSEIEIEASSDAGGILEVWINNLEGTGTKIATLNIKTTAGSNWEKFNADISSLSGQHDIFLRWSGSENAFFVRNVQFISNISSNTTTIPTSESHDWIAYPNPFDHEFTIVSSFYKTQYHIFSMDGKSIEKGIINNSEQKLGDKLKPGVYLIKLTSGETSQSYKLFKIKK